VKLRVISEAEVYGIRTYFELQDEVSHVAIQTEAAAERLHPSVEAEVLRRASSKETPIPLKDVLKDLGL
jgi:hypothetical protein